MHSLIPLHQLLTDYLAESLSARLRVCNEIVSKHDFEIYPSLNFLKSRKLGGISNVRKSIVRSIVYENLIFGEACKEHCKVAKSALGERVRKKLKNMIAPKILCKY